MGDTSDSEDEENGDFRSETTRNLNGKKHQKVGRKNTLKELADYLNDQIMIMPLDFLKVPSGNTPSRGGSGSLTGLHDTKKGSLASMKKNLSSSTKASTN